MSASHMLYCDSCKRIMMVLDENEKLASCAYVEMSFTMYDDKGKCIEFKSLALCKTCFTDSPWNTTKAKLLPSFDLQTEQTKAMYP